MSETEEAPQEKEPLTSEQLARVKELTDQLDLWPTALVGDDKPYAIYDFKHSPPRAVWNHDRMQRDLERAGLR